MLLLSFISFFFLSSLAAIITITIKVDHLVLNSNEEEIG